ncbi:MAG: hypothetical protein Q8R12_02205 [bacterium]|nr:hypothetical protein [bacterium]
MAIEKVSIKPVEAVPIEHHRSLPEGLYKRVAGYGRPGEIILLREVSKGALYLVRWDGKQNMFSDFEIGPSDKLEAWSFGAPDADGHP